MFVCRLFCGPGAPSFRLKVFGARLFPRVTEVSEDESRLDIWEISYYTIIIAT